MAEKFYGLTNDVAFKMAFAEHNDLLRMFISDMLDIPREDLKEVVVENPEIVPDEVDGKYSRMDIRANIGNEIVNIEMQCESEQGYEKRVMYYWSGIYHNQLKKGEQYSSLKKTISMNILAYTKFPWHDDYHSKYELVDREHGHVIGDLLELHFFEISKALKGKCNDKKHKWLKFISTSNPQELEDFKNANDDDFVEEGVKIVNTINADTRFKEIIQMIEDSEHERAHYIDMAERRGREAGHRERDNELIKIWKRKGFTDEQIKELLGN